MKIAIGGDHAGFTLKQHLVELIKKWGHEVNDLGAFNTEPSDYPDFAKSVGMAVQKGEAERGLIVCGSGIGACVAANKLKGIRAALISDTYSARQGVDHDDVNVLCLGGRVVGPALAEEIVKAFLAAKFSGEERHLRRLNKVKAMEEGK
jgi:ribose 5-phosphate isomerase B